MQGDRGGYFEFRQKNLGNYWTKYKKIWQPLAGAIFLAIFFSIPATDLNYARAATESELRSQINNLQQKMDETNALLQQKENETRSLANEVAAFDAQISKIQLEINSTQAQIELINVQINNLNLEIRKIETDMKKEKETLNNYLRIIYEDSRVSIIEQLASSNSFSDFVDRSEYLQTMQFKVKQSIDKIKKLKDEAEAKKKDLEEKNRNFGDLKKQQVAQKENLDAQRAAKQQILDKTRGEEAAFQAMVSDIKAQYDKMQTELWSLANSGNYVSYGHVNRGDIIGYEGNSGYSTGPHLHFEVRAGGADVNPLVYINNGTFTHPMPGAYVSQYWSEIGRLAGYSRHTGMDLCSPYGTPVRATDSGEIIGRVSGYDNTYPGQVVYGNYVMIAHPNGLISLYGHLQ